MSTGGTLMEEKVAQVIAKLGDDKDFRAEILRELPIREMLQESMRTSNSPVKDALTEILVRSVERMEVLDEDIITGSMSMRDWHQIIPELLKSEAGREALLEDMKSYMGNGFSDDMPYKEALDAALKDEQMIAQITSETAVQDAIRGAVIKYFNDLDLTNEEDVIERLLGIAFSEERLTQLVEEHRSEIDAKLQEQIPQIIAQSLGNSRRISDLVERAVLESTILKKEVERAVETALRGTAVEDALQKFILRRLGI